MAPPRSGNLGLSPGSCVQFRVQTSLGQGQKLVTAWGLGCLRHCVKGRYAGDGHGFEHVTPTRVRLCVCAHILIFHKHLFARPPHC